MSDSKLKSNEDLYNYLLQLGEHFRDREKLDIADEITQVSKFAYGSASEFLHESEILLLRLQQQFRDLLSKDQINDMTGVVEQIRDAFRRVGSA